MIDKAIKQRLDNIEKLCRDIGREISIMEVCGTHTVSLMRSGVKSMLPEQIRLISGPGCPVCVTSQGYIDAACQLSLKDDVIICSYGDMLRVPGDKGSLEKYKALGADVRIVYSARDAIGVAKSNLDKSVVFLAVGFETTTPPTALTIKEARAEGIDNLYMLCAHKLVIPAMEILLGAEKVNIDGFMCPGHVSVVIGADAYKVIVEKFNRPCVITGFEPEQMVAGIEAIVAQIAADDIKVENKYNIAVKDAGNVIAQNVINEVFKVSDVIWRAMGVLPKSGLELKDEYRDFDARVKFGLNIEQDKEIPGCRCGEVIQGIVNPKQCPLFGKKCSPAEPVGPCMVSSEGTCAAWYKYGSVI